MKIYLVLLVCISLAFNSKAAPSPKISIGKFTFKNAHYEDPEPSGEFTTLVIPIKRAQNLIIIQAGIDTLQGNFVLDTGAPYLVLNQTYFRDWPRYNDVESAGVNGSAGGSSFRTVVRNLNITDLHFDRLLADVTDLSAIENSHHIKVLGLLGTKLFAKFAITVDLFQNVLYIHKLDKKGNIPLTEVVYHNEILKTPFYYANNVVLLKVKVNEHGFWFAFDTAAETNLVDYTQVKKLMGDMEIVSRATMTGIGGSSFNVLYARFNKLEVGQKTFISNRVLITSLDKMGTAFGHDVDGILGYDFFTRGVFSINFVKEEFTMYDKEN